MRTKYQKSESDCGPAAVATLCNVNVEEAADYIYGKRGRKGATPSGCLIDAVKHFGRKPLATRCTSLTEEHELPDFEHDALLGCDCLVPNGRGGWKRSGHWAVWDSKSQCIRDPYGYYYPLAVKKFLLVK